MTYIDLINRFWELDRIKPFAATDSKLYFYLLSECNVRLWLNPFELQTRHIEVCLGISRKSITESRNRLKQRGLIDVAKARGREASVYVIKGVKVTDSDSYRNRFVLPAGNTKGNTTVTEAATQEQHNGDPHLIKDKEKRLKTKDTLPCGSAGTRDKDNSGGEDMFGRCSDHFLSDGQHEYRQLLRRHYGIDDPAAAFAEFRRILIEEDLLGEIHTRQDFARLFKFKYCLRRPVSSTATPHTTNHQTTNDYETGRNDRFYRRRSTEPTAVRAEDYTSTL